MKREKFIFHISSLKFNETVLVICNNEDGLVKSIFIPRASSLSHSYLSSVATYYPQEDRFEVDDIIKTTNCEREYIPYIYYANEDDKKKLFEVMNENGYDFKNNKLIKLDSPEMDIKYGPTIDEFSFFNVKRDLSGNIMPHYYVNSYFTPLVRYKDDYTTEWTYKVLDDIAHYNYFSNIKDAEEANRRVIRTLRQFQKEIMQRNKK